MDEDEKEASFGQSQFKGKDDMVTHFRRWLIQFAALFLKGACVLARRPLQLLLFLSIPSVFFLTFLIEAAGGGSGDSSVGNYPPAPLVGLGKCDAYHDCIRVVFGPEDANTQRVMTTFCELNGLTYGSEVLPFSTVDETQEFVAEQLGRVQYTVLFSNQSLWETDMSQNYMYPIQPLPKNMSYVIFYNASHTSGDARSERYKVDFPLLVLQKTLEEAYMRSAPDRAGDFSAFDVDYGTLWGVPLASTTAALNITTPCDLPQRSNMATLGVAMPWVLAVSFMLMANVSFGLVAEERKKHLFTSLRRMGLIDSAYWAAWVALFQLLLLVACAMSLVTAVLVRPSSSALRELDLSLAFVLLWCCGSAFISLSLFLAALCSSSSVETSVTFAQFLLAMITIISCIKPLCSYSYVEDEETGQSQCKLLASSYNTMYSKDLMGNTFVQFLVWWMPFFHGAQISTDILSVLQYKGQSISLSDMAAPPMALSYMSTSAHTFETKWVQWSLLMLMSNTLAYVFLAWFTAQVMSSDASEGRSLLNILLPATVRRLLLPEEEVVAGDVRGEERLKSAEEKNVRAYKVSKTFSGVQALKEVSFTMKRGEVFVMLGHNGAGKSTLINIITGVLAPTHGKVYLNGLDVERDSADVQQTIGICSQDDLLWDDLTAREHMLLTAAFKGLKWGNELFAAVDKMLSRVQLLDRADDFCRQFSGGMKRRLSVAMSTVGDVEILFLDEPTTGLDPVSRRRVWETINWMKKDRVVVLTTHNMEEADYLADSIMIMHGGHVRAFGDPLFLKQTYGKGYQVNLTVTPAHSDEARALVAAVLPDSTCAVDETACSLAVTVPRNNLRGLPRLFTWLESSSRAAQVVREWGISNTTLEQVFLMLCDLNTEINNVSGVQSESSRRELCPMCRVNTKSTVFVRNLEGRLLIVPDSVCWECINKNDSYMVTEEQVAFALEDGTTAEQRMSGMLVAAQSKAEAATTTHMLALENTELNDGLDAFQEGEGEGEVSPGEEQAGAVHVVADSGADSDKRPLTRLEMNEDVAEVRGQRAHPGSLSDDRMDGAPLDQVRAIFVKNIVLQSKQKCSNCCAVFFVALMFLMLYVMSLLFESSENTTVCGAGYLSDTDCSLETLVQHVFSGSWNDMVQDDWEWGLDDDTVGPYGYTVKYYMVPATQFSGGIAIFGDSNSNYYNYGFPNYNYNRYAMLWSSFVDSGELQDVSQALGLDMYSRGIPAAGATDGNAPNALMWDNQQAVAASVETNQEETSLMCYDYAPDFVVNASTAEVFQNYSDLFADGVFYCEECSATARLAENYTEIFFNGTVWCAESVKQCYDSSCEPYPYGFMNFFIDGATVPSNHYLGDKCPAGVNQLSMNSQNEYTLNTYRVMSYLNLLTNAVLSPTLQTFDVQGGVSPYGDLNFDAQLISQNLANILTVIAMMLMNGFWPLAVWRLAHERSNNIVLMVHTSGMRKVSYMSGMFLFDMAVSVVSGVGMILFAVLLGLSRFDGAPVGYLVAIVVLSALALNGGAQLLVIASRKKASVLPLAAPCLMVASVVSSSLLNILVYPEDGDWKWPLSIYPFLAQGRALYIILVYHRGTTEVDESIVLMAVFGVLALLLTFALEMESDLRLHLQSLLASKDNKLESSDAASAGAAGAAGAGEEELDVESARPVDKDVQREEELAMAYECGRDATLAIVIQRMRHEFPNGFQAVKGLSLALQYGECFGLLGPNGAGKSTTISILSGTVLATAGKQFVAGCDLKVDPGQIHKYVGICPQFDVVWHDLTVAEHLSFQARQRGVPARRLVAEVQKAALAVGLDGDGFYTKAGVLSGGMRRRLSIAMSIVGDPPIVFMDEPTTGLDPDNRQQVWRIIQSLKTPNRLILMTTHSMEEAEALCSRIGIMARGALQCVGSAQHLKAKYGKGYTLTVNLLPPPERAAQHAQHEQLMSFVVDTLSGGGGVLLSSINHTRKFLVPRGPETSISRIFKVMETNRERLGVREWGLSMSTLEDVFISAVEEGADAGPAL